MGQGTGLTSMNRHPEQVSVPQTPRVWVWLGCRSLALLLLLLSKREVHRCRVPKPDPSPSFSSSLGRILRFTTLDLGWEAVGGANHGH